MTNWKLIEILEALRDAGLPDFWQLEANQLDEKLRFYRIEYADNDTEPYFAYSLFYSGSLNIFSINKRLWFSESYDELYKNTSLPEAIEKLRELLA